MEPVSARVATTEPSKPQTSDSNVRAEPSPRSFTLWQRAKIFLASWVGFFAVSTIGRTLRFDVEGWENWEAGRKLGKGLIYTFWHREIFAATWFWRHRGIVVMTSQNFDGEYIARIIQRCGYGAARGSSSRGGRRALMEMARGHARGIDSAFTIDGPRGPRYVAKPGAVLLAQLTGAPILCFHIALHRAYVFRKSWDLFQIPYPFSRAAIWIAPPITVDRNAQPEEQAKKVQEVQKTLDELRARGDAWRKVLAAGGSTSPPGRKG